VCVGVPSSNMCVGVPSSNMECVAGVCVGVPG